MLVLEPTSIDPSKQSRNYMYNLLSGIKPVYSAHTVYFCAPCDSQQAAGNSTSLIGPADGPLSLWRAYMPFRLTLVILFSPWRPRFDSGTVRARCGGQTAKGTGLFLPTFSVSPVSIIPSSFYSLFSSVTITPPITYILFSHVSIIPPTIYTLLPLSVTFHQYPIFPFPLSVSF